MDGLLFYFIFWIGWIITTFFYPKTHPDRFYFSVWLLISILLSNKTIEVHGILINMTGLWIIVTGCYYGAKLHMKQLIYFLLATFIIMLSTVCFLLFELFDPIWVLIEREWLLAIIISFVTWILESSKKQRLIIMMFGMIQGELFYAYILLKYPFQHPVASLYFLDALAVSFTIIIVFQTVETLAGYVERQFHTGEKEREKLS